MKLLSILEAGFVDYTRSDSGDGNITPPEDLRGDDDQFTDDSELDQPTNDSQQDGQEVPPTASNNQEQDPDRQGSIRTIPDAHLVYKRKNENNLYDELWIYKQNQHDTWTLKSYDAIIAGSDIPKGSAVSEDGTQSVERWEVGDPKDLLVFVKISGLTN